MTVVLYAVVIFAVIAPVVDLMDAQVHSTLAVAVDIGVVTSVVDIYITDLLVLLANVITMDVLAVLNITSAATAVDFELYLALVAAVEAAVITFVLLLKSMLERM